MQQPTDPRARLIRTVQDAPDEQDPKTMLRVVTLNDGTIYTYAYGKDAPPARADVVQGTPFDPANFTGLNIVDISRNNEVADDYARDIKAATAAPTVRTINGIEHQWDAGKQTWVPIGRPKPQGQWVGSNYYTIDPETNAPMQTGFDEPGLAAQQQRYDYAATAEARAAERARLDAQKARDDRDTSLGKAEVDRLEALVKVGKMDQDEAKAQFDQWWKINVELPREREKNQLELRDKAETTATAAGNTGVKDYLERAPYQYSPGFMQRYTSALSGDPRQAQYNQPSLAAPYRPAALDVPQVRVQAENTARTAALDRYGFDPVGVANQVAYRPAGPQAPPPVDDDEIVRRYQQRLTGAVT